jgi:hypothetical protein
MFREGLYMKKSDSIQTEWARLAKQITDHLLDRREILEQDLYPGRRFGADDRNAAIKNICQLNRKISRLADAMAKLESQNTDIGVRALLKSEPSDLMRLVVVVLATARFDLVAKREISGVDDILAVVGAQDAEDCLAVRALFREDSPLRPHLVISFSNTLDESDVRLKEQSINTILHQKKDASEKITEAVSITGRWK